MYTLEELNTPPLCILHMLMPQIMSPLHMLSPTHGGGVMILGIRILGVLKVEKSNELIIVILYW